MLDLLTTIDWAWLPVLFGISFGGGSSGSSQSSQSQSITGLQENKDITGRLALALLGGYAAPLSGGTVPKNVPGTLPEHFDPGQLYGQFTGGQPTPINPLPQLPGLDNLGLYPEQRAGFDEAVKQATSQLSGGYANRGYIRPENIGAIAGAAAQNVLPQFMPLQGQNILNAAQVPEALGAQRLSGVSGLLQVISSLLGGTSQSTGFGSSHAQNFNGGILNSGAGQQAAIEAWG